MRPDTVDWNNKRKHVAVGDLPDRWIHQVIRRWMVMCVLIQAATTMALIVAIDQVKWIGQALDSLTSDLGQFTEEQWGWGVWLTPFVLGSAFAVAVALLCVGIILLTVARGKLSQWTRGLGRLHETTRTLASGGEPLPLVLTGNAEIDHLLAGFNDMAARLRADHRALIATNKNLEDLVAQRTKQWQRASQESEQANEAKSHFLATMTHEIRTPLNGVIGTLQLLERSALDSKQNQMVRTGTLAAKALLNLINDVLDFSSIEAGELELAHGPFVLEQVVDEAVAIVDALAKPKGLELTYEIDSAIHDAYQGDAARLRQILMNLLNNAVKFTDEGSIRVHVSLDESDNSLLRFEVSDTGIGIPSDALQLLFDEFQQAGNDPSHQRGGTGLGLAICKNFSQRMGGQIGVRSTVGQGSTFWFTIQLEPAQAHQVQETESTELPNCCGVRVLVADDNPTNQFVVRHMLETLGVKVADITLVTNGRLAVDALLLKRYDLVLMDYRMPVLDGIAATEEIRALEMSGKLDGRTKIVALTANVMQHSSTSRRQDIFTRAGMNGYLMKPIDLNELGRLIVEHVDETGIESEGDSLAPSHETPKPEQPESENSTLKLNADCEPTHHHASLLDFGHMQKICQNRPEALNELFEIVEQQFSVFKQEVSAVSAGENDPDVAARLGHKISGCALQLNINTLAKTAGILEQNDEQERRNAADQLERLLDNCLVELHELASMPTPSSEPSAAT